VTLTDCYLHCSVFTVHNFTKSVNFCVVMGDWAARASALLTVMGELRSPS